MKAPTDRPSCRPAEICGRLLAALDASEGRRRRRKRDTTPDSLGMAIKRRLLEETVRGDPDPDAYEGWLLERCLGQEGPSGPVQAMALEIFAEWKLARRSDVFRSWLIEGAPSEDAEGGSPCRAPVPPSIQGRPTIHHGNTEGTEFHGKQRR